MQLKEVHSLAATATPGVLKADITFTDDVGNDERCDYLTVAGDPYGINPALQELIAANPDFPVALYADPEPPTAEELRAAMPALTMRQFRLALLAAGKLSLVAQAIAALPSPNKEAAEIEWEYAASVERLNQFVVMLAPTLSLTAEQIDTMWEQAKTL